MELTLFRLEASGPMLIGMRVTQGRASAYTHVYSAAYSNSVVNALPLTCFFDRPVSGSKFVNAATAGGEPSRYFFATLGS